MPPMYWSTGSQWLATAGWSAPSVPRIGEANEIPRGIRRTCPSCRFRAAQAGRTRTGDVLPGRMAVERVARRVEGHVVGQLDRQILFRNRHDAVDLAMDDRDRAAPVALARDAPVAQLEIDLPLALRPVAERRRLQPARDLRLGPLDRHAVEETRVDHQAVAVIGDLVDREGLRDRRPAGRRPASRRGRRR